MKQTSLGHKEKTKTSKEGDLNDTEKDLRATQEELDAALAYYDKLKPSAGGFSGPSVATSRREYTNA